MEKWCPNCGEKLPQDANFCGKCGMQFVLQREQIHVEECRKKPSKKIIVGVLVGIIFCAVLVFLNSNNRLEPRLQQEEPNRTVREIEVDEETQTLEAFLNNMSGIWVDTTTCVVVGDDATSFLFCAIENGEIYTGAYPGGCGRPGIIQTVDRVSDTQYRLSLYYEEVDDDYYGGHCDAEYVDSVLIVDGKSFYFSNSPNTVYTYMGKDLESAEVAVVAYLQETAAEAKATVTALYQDKIEEYRQALAMGREAFEKKYNVDGEIDCTSINAHMIDMIYSCGGEFYYDIMDINHDGTPEIIFSNGGDIGDIYTVHDSTVIKLFENCQFGAQYWGASGHLYILSSGALVTINGALTYGQYEIYKIDENTGKLSNPTECYYYAGAGPNPDMRGYTFLSSDEYMNKLNTLLKDSISDEIDWTLIAKCPEPEYEEEESDPDDDILEEGTYFTISGTVGYSSDGFELSDEYCYVNSDTEVMYYYTDSDGNRELTSSNVFYCIGDDIDTLRPYVDEEVMIEGELYTTDLGNAVMLYVSLW